MQSIYKNLRINEESQSPEFVEIRDWYFRAIKKTMLSLGFNQAAVRAFRMSMVPYTLTLGDDEKAHGVSHVFADGRPFYKVSVSMENGSIYMLQGARQADLRVLPSSQQAAWLAATVGCDVLPKTDRYVVEYCGGNPVFSGGRMTGDLAKLRFEADTRHEPLTFLECLHDMTGCRLKEAVQPKRVAARPLNLK